jgi:hypothetical protein
MRAFVLFYKNTLGASNIFEKQSKVVIENPKSFVCFADSSSLSATHESFHELEQTR